MMNEPKHVIELEAAVDSLTTVTVNLEERNKELQEGIDNLISGDDEEVEEIEETKENKEIVDE
jgi:exonuclease VII small subunit